MKTIQEMYGLKSNPFRMTPAANPEELVWAGFSDVRTKIEKRIQRSVNLQNSSLVLNWGDYGSGKTHAARYFKKQSVLEAMSGEHSLPFVMLLDFPKGKEPVFELYTKIIDKLDIGGIRSALGEDAKEKARIVVNDNILLSSILEYILDNTVDPAEAKAFLYGSLGVKEALIKRGIQRKLNTDNDYIDFLAGLFSLLTFEKKPYSCMILWIDEFEDISLQNSSNVGKINNMIRGLLDKSPNNLLIFLNLTQSAMMDVNDLSDYLQEAVGSRIKERIELAVPGLEDLKNYVKELMNNPLFRDENKGYYPFDENVIDEIIKDKKAGASLRAYNEIFSTLLEDAAYEEVLRIDTDFYNSEKSELFGVE